MLEIQFDQQLRKNMKNIVLQEIHFFLLGRGTKTKMIAVEVW